MRRLAGLIVVGLLLVVPAMAALGETGSYADDFSEGGYTGNIGTLYFAGPWVEFGDTGGPGSGMVHIGDENCSNNQCLHIEGSGPVVEPFGIDRSSDTSIFQSVQLRYDIVVEASGSDRAELLVEVWNGSGWVVVDTFNLSKSAVRTKSVPVTSYMGAEFAVRFKVPHLFEGDPANFTGTVTVDQIEVSGALTSTTPTSTTTTTTTTTSTTTPTTTSTTHPATTTSTTHSTTTTTTAKGGTTSTTAGPTTTSIALATTTTASASTTSSVAIAAPPSDEEPPSELFETGILDPGTGLVVNHQTGMNGDMALFEGAEVLSAEVTTNFSLAVESIEASRVWLAGLSLIIAGALVSSMDHRRTRNGAFVMPSAGKPLVQG